MRLPRIFYEQALFIYQFITDKKSRMFFDNKFNSDPSSPILLQWIHLSTFDDTTFQTSHLKHLSNYISICSVYTNNFPICILWI